MNAADILADLNVTRQLILNRLASGEQAQLMRQLDDISAQIERALLRSKPLTDFSRKRLNDAVRQLQGFVALKVPDLSGLPALEADFVVDSFAKLSLGSQLPSAQVLERIGRVQFVEGAPMGDWFNRLERDTRFHVSRAVRAGVGAGLTNAEIAGQIASISNKGGQVLARTRRDAMAITRTGVMTVANDARLATYEENADLVRGVQWVSTLDGRTSDICVARSGKVWLLPDYEPEGHTIPFNGGPPAHFNCRSTTVPVLPSLEEMGIDPEGIPPATRSSMDGQVAQDLSFDDFLKGKSPEFVDDLLGVGRAQLYRDGRITLTQLLDQQGNPLTLRQLEERYGPAQLKVGPVAPAVAPSTPPAPPALPDPPVDVPEAPKPDTSTPEGSAQAAIDRIAAYEGSQAELLAAKGAYDVAEEQLLAKVRDYNRRRRSRTEKVVIEEYVELLEEQKALGAQAKALRELQDAEAGRQLKLIHVDDALKGKASNIIEGKVPPSRKARVTEAANIIANLVSKARLPRVTIVATRMNRAGYTNHNRHAHIPTKADVSTVVHEIIHDIEYAYPEVSRATKAFLLRRANGEGLQSLRKITGNRAYGPDEVTYVDQFAERGGSHYMGRLYDREATELLTMGMERLLENPRLFYEQDEEYFVFLIRILHGAVG
tara:strand:+ start:287 stop:2263 length:1977 start_codon:yes stop_codon:yes gene_type:complete